MDERREQPAPAERRPVVAAGTRLSPPQEAYDQYSRHFTRCWTCRDVDQNCPTGTELHRAWRKLADRTLDQLADKPSLPQGQ